MPVSLSTLALGLTIGLLQAAPPGDPLAASTTQLVERVSEAYRACGQQPTFPATVEVQTHPALVSYQFTDRTMRVSRYEELPPEMQGLMSAWANTAGQPSGASLFGDIFNSLLVPHEMGHWMQHISRRAITLDRWESEVEANRIAIAYWSLDAEDAARLPARIEAFSGFLGQLPDPVPDGEDPRAYFNEHYESFDAAQYGWFQGAFMREAWARRAESGFCDLARLNAAAPIEAFANDPAS
ncbi:MAG: hypothetical protein KKE52_04995 [Alphaproteobacteria bacterium]|nr:hypothetical protein [Alphaproteobacteria bacterium]MBU2270640.1 hypothetical protein [Alphaproteobacteria bacterium]